MIIFQLCCHDEHTFEAWFKDSYSCDNQASVGLVECPYCGSTKISKVSDALKDPVPQLPVGVIDDNQVRAHEVAQKILDAVSKLRDFAEANFKNVGALEAVERSARNETEDEDVLDIDGLPSRTGTND
ncbi:MAG: DUF1178 family protein [Magnetovibrio sp.]|nr:DUF1178 family protein [Magnetovibrio sp.]